MTGKLRSDCPEDFSRDLQLPFPNSRVRFKRAAILACAAACLILPRVHAAQAEPDALSPLVVTAPDTTDEDKDYPVTEASTATRTDTPIAKTPLAIQVIPESVIEDQGVFRLKDVYRNVSSVAPVKTEGSGIQFENVLIRGFQEMMSVDGVNLYTLAPLNLSGVQRVEVLKGPASSMYGAIEPGGMINVMPQLASFSPHQEVYGEYGSYDSYRAGFNLGSKVGEDVAVRLAGDYQDSDSFRDYLHNRSTFIAPSVTWNISDCTRLSAWLWFQDVDRPYDNGVAFTRAGYPVGPISENFTGPEHNSQAIQDTLASVQLDHRISDDLSIRAKFLVHNFEGQIDAIRTSQGAGNTLTNFLDKSMFHNWQYDLLTDALWKFDIGETKHQVIFGVQANRNDYSYIRLTDPLPAINIFNPVTYTGSFHFIPGAYPQATITETLGGYLQEQMDAFGDRLHVLVGGRVDYVDQYYRSFTNGKEFNQDDTGVSGRGGLVYDFTPNVSAYGNISRSFNPTTAGQSLGNGGEPIDPTTGLQYEAGLKMNFLDKKLAVTTAVYQITKDNVPVADPNNPGFSVNGGELRSQGVELDVLGQITPNLQIIGNYAYTDSEVLESSNLPVGARFAGVPLQSGSLWVKYDFTDGPLKNFGMGAGMFASTFKAGDNNNSFDLPGYARFDAAMWYKIQLEKDQELKLQLNAQNIFDKRYYESSTSTANVQPGTPAAIFAKCSLTF